MFVVMFVSLLVVFMESKKASAKLISFNYDWEQKMTVVNNNGRYVSVGFTLSSQC